MEMKTPLEMTAQLVSLGFVQGDQEADLGLRREWLVYLKREYQKQFLCLWITTYDNRFVEAILLVYAKPLNSRAKPAMVPLRAEICRSLEEILTAVEKVY